MTNLALLRRFQQIACLALIQDQENKYSQSHFRPICLYTKNVAVILIGLVNHVVSNFNRIFAAKHLCFARDVVKNCVQPRCQV